MLRKVFFIDYIPQKCNNHSNQPDYCQLHRTDKISNVEHKAKTLLWELATALRDIFRPLQVKTVYFFNFIKISLHLYPTYVDVYKRMNVVKAEVYSRINVSLYLGITLKI